MSKNRANDKFPLFSHFFWKIRWFFVRINVRILVTFLYYNTFSNKMKGVFAHEIDKRAVFFFQFDTSDPGQHQRRHKCGGYRRDFSICQQCFSQLSEPKAGKYDRKTHFPILSCRRSSNSVRKSSSHSG